MRKRLFLIFILCGLNPGRAAHNVWDLLLLVVSPFVAFSNKIIFRSGFFRVHIRPSPEPGCRVADAGAFMLPPGEANCGGRTWTSANPIQPVRYGAALGQLSRLTAAHWWKQRNRDRTPQDVLASDQEGFQALPWGF